MRIDGSQRIRTPILRCTEHTVELFEPFHCATENAVLGQRFGHISRNHAKILAHDHATGARRFQRENAEHDVRIVMHVGAVHGLLAFRNPPQAEQAENMVDTHRARIGEHAMHHVSIHLVTGLIKGNRVQRRLAPILTLLVEHVWRGADRGTLGETLRIPPHVGTGRVHTHRHVGDDANLHAGVTRRLLGRMQLLGGDPFEPTVEFERVRILRAKLRDLFGITIELTHPIVVAAIEGAPLVVAQAPRGIGFDLIAHFGEILVELSLTLCGKTCFVDDPQRLHLGAPHRFTVQNLRIAVEGFDLLVQCVDLRLVFRRKRGIFRHGFRTNIAEVDETARNRQIRRRLNRWHWLGGMQRVDQHEVGTGLLLGFDEQGLQILIIADSPRTVGTDGIELAHPTPQGAVLHLVKQFDLLRSTDNGCRLRLATHGDFKGVIPFGKVFRKHQVRRAHKSAIDLDRGTATALMLDFAGIRLAIFQRDGSCGNVKRAAMDLYLALLTDNMQHGRRNDSGVAFTLNGGDGLFDRIIVGSVDSKCLEHRHKNIVFDFVVVTAHTDITGGDTHQLRQTNERTG